MTVNCVMEPVISNYAIEIVLLFLNLSLLFNCNCYYSQKRDLEVSSVKTILIYLNF